MNNGQMEIKDRFEQMYQTGLTPWTKHPPEPSLSKFLEYLKKQNPQAKILDIGCGNGWISILAAKLNFDVWGIDSSKTAIAEAKKAAKEEDVDENTHFKVGDGLDLPYKDKQFDVLIDRGFFHHILPKNRGIYLDNILRVLKEESYFYLSVFSKRNHEGIGQRFNKDDITDIFGENFEIIKFDKDQYPTMAPAHLLHFVLKR